MARYNLKQIDILKIDIEGSEKQMFEKNFEKWLIWEPECQAALQDAKNSVAFNIWETDKAVADIDDKIDALKRPWHEAKSTGTRGKMSHLLLTQRLTRYSIHNSSSLQQGSVNNHQTRSHVLEECQVSVRGCLCVSLEDKVDKHGNWACCAVLSVIVQGHKHCL